MAGMQDDDVFASSSSSPSFYDLLDDSPHSSRRTVDLVQLRQLCSQGIPDHPPHLRPLAYSLLLGTLPPAKSEWKIASRNQRSQYHELIEMHLDPLETLPINADSQTQDKEILTISRDVLSAQARFPLLKHRAKRDANDPEDSDSSSSSNAMDALPPSRVVFERIEKLLQAERAGEGQSSQGSDPSDEHMETIASPKISLSQPQSQPMSTPTLSLSAPEAIDSEPSSPITLLKPKPLPTIGLLEPHSHAEAVCRLLILFVHTNPQWTYHQNHVDIAAHLYFTFSQIRYTSSRRPTTHGRSAEEQTYWTFCALMREFASILVDSSAMSRGLECLGRRIRWADEPLWSHLCENDLDPSTPLYTSRWMDLLLLRDLPRRFVAPAWDFLLSSRSTPTLPDDALDALVDMCTAVLMMSRPILLQTSNRSPVKGLWSNSDSQLLYDPAQQLQLLRSLPLDQVCAPKTLLAAANRLQEARVIDKVPELQLDYVVPSWQIVETGQKLFESSLPTLSSAASIASNTTSSMWSSFRAWSKKPKAAASVPAPGTPIFDSPIPQTPPPPTSNRSSLASVTSPPNSNGSKPMLKGPRPLLLSGSARRASNPITHPRATSTSSNSPPVGALSPPHPTVESTSLYKFGSRNGHHRSRSSSVEPPEPQSNSS